MRALTEKQVRRSFVNCSRGEAEAMTLPRTFAGKVEAFTGEEATAERGVRLHGRAYLCIRGWISPVVKVELTEPADPAPYWVLSTRRPEQLVAALTASKV